jgi:HemY protein
MAIRRLLWLIFLFAAAVGLAIIGQKEVGHIIIIYASTRIDLSLNFFIFLCLLAVCVFYLALRIVRYFWLLPVRFAAYRVRVRQSKARIALREALRDWFTGNFARAEKEAKRAYPNLCEENKSLVSLVGAQAAHGMRDFTGRDTWLTQVTATKWQDAKYLCLAEMQADHEDTASAQAVLNALAQMSTQSARCPVAQRLALCAYERLGQWADVLRVASSLEKGATITPALARRSLQLAAENLLYDRRYNPQALMKCWHSLPDAERHSPTLVDFVALILIDLQEYDTARRIIEEALEYRWESSLLHRYADCAGDALVSSIRQAEIWRAAHPRDPHLSLTLGRLCLLQKLWGKAQSFFEDALKFSAEDVSLKSEIHAALAQLHETLEHRNQAQEHYRASVLARQPHALPLLKIEESH